MALYDNLLINSVPSITGSGSEREPTIEPLFRVKSFSPDLPDQKLQDVYGTSSLQMFPWARRVLSGETAVVGDQFEGQYAQELSRLSDAEIASQGIDPPALRAVLAPILDASVQGFIGRAGAGFDQSLTGEAANEAFFSQLGPTFKSYLPGALPKGVVNPAWAKQLNLRPGQVAIDRINATRLLSLKPKLNITEAGKSHYVIPETDYDAINTRLELGKEPPLAQVARYPGADDDGFFGNLFSSEEGGGLRPRTPSFGETTLSAATTLAMNLISGQKPIEAAKNMALTTGGRFVGTAIAGPVGGFIGGTIGAVIGGRVICNELHRQGIMTLRQVVLDYKFTRKYLTPQHITGYHVWSIWMVRQMRKGKFVKFWKHVAGHRANEIAYIYGERDKPDYFGKVYRKILEPTCWALGAFCKETDWSILYKHKETQSA